MIICSACFSKRDDKLHKICHPVPGMQYLVSKGFTYNVNLFPWGPCFPLRTCKNRPRLNKINAVCLHDLPENISFGQFGKNQSNHQVRFHAKYHALNIPFLMMFAGSVVTC